MLIASLPCAGALARIPPCSASLARGRHTMPPVAKTLRLTTAVDKRLYRGSRNALAIAAPTLITGRVTSPLRQTPSSFRKDLIV
ncbi:hypothetical protein SKAU_G00352990 [Synaphobranchus kaupii]|uniref:Uncharacterized protein n=1 Tax=Synaphobranchus kaupii TaxID=118154 RepID=A0A9Q1IIC5_SYNKA|nr:hypothetical protein SKAU_G00352990 [Synaphobranchus kaupii]